MKAVICEGVGDVNVLTIGNLPEPEPGPEQVLVRVHASGINRADILQRRGLYPAPPGDSSVLGLEIAGEIVHRGKEVTHLQLGQRVFGLVGGGGYAEYCCLDQDMAIPMPSSWTYPMAAATPEAFFTAHDALFNHARIEPGETILIQAGGSGVGTAMVQLAKHRGVKVIFTTSSVEKIAAVCALGADHGILSNYRDTDFVEPVLEFTQQKGVDVIVDFIGKDTFPAHLKLLRIGGRLVQLALMSGHLTELDMRVLMTKRLQIMGSTLRSRSLHEKRVITQQFRDHCLPLMAEGILKPVIDSVYPYSDVIKAHQRLESRLAVGKLILAW